MESHLLLNIDELMVKHEHVQEHRKKIFDDVLRFCHNKIKKYNSEFHAHECTYAPPKFIVGCPPYNYAELVSYVIMSLRSNGLKAEWIPHEEKIYISWKPSDINLGLYQSHFQRTVYGTSVDDQGTPMTLVKVQPLPKEHMKSKSKSKSKNKLPKPQHMAIVKYTPDTTDMIPINLK